MPALQVKAAKRGKTSNSSTPGSMRAVRLHLAGGPVGLKNEEMDTPRPGAGEVLVRVHAAAITRDELDWPVDRLPAIPSYEFSGVVAALGSPTAEFTIGEDVYARARSIAMARRLRMLWSRSNALHPSRAT